MNTKKYPRLFDLGERGDKLTRMGDSLVGLNERIDQLRDKPRPSDRLRSNL